MKRYLFNCKVTADDFASWRRPGRYGTARYDWLNEPWYRAHAWISQRVARLWRKRRRPPAFAKLRRGKQNKRRLAIGDLVRWPNGTVSKIGASRVSTTKPFMSFAPYKPDRKPGIGDYEWVDEAMLHRELRPVMSWRKGYGSAVLEADWGRTVCEKTNKESRKAGIKL